MKKAKKQKPARRKRTRAEAKAIRKTFGANARLLEAGLTPSLREFQRYMFAANEIHWKGEDSDDHWVYEWALEEAFDEDTIQFSPFSIERLEEQAQEYAQNYDQEDPDSIEPLQEPVQPIVERLAERGLVTFDSRSGMISIVPLPETVGV